MPFADMLGDNNKIPRFEFFTPGRLEGLPRIVSGNNLTAIEGEADLGRSLIPVDYLRGEADCSNENSRNIGRSRARRNDAEF